MTLLAVEVPLVGVVGRLVPIKAEDLGYWDDASKKFVIEKMVHQLYVGPSADPQDANMKTTTFTIQ